MPDPEALGAIPAVSDRSLLDHPETSRRVDHDRRENRVFWSRFGERPDFRGQRVLEIGSGWGVLSLDIALSGAERVVGLDLKQTRVDFANGYLHAAHPELADRLEYRRVHLGDFEETLFDCIVSKDTFEHIVDLDDMLRAMKERLRPGGKIWAGFGPLYPSPYGDHDRRRMILRPWGIRGKLLSLIPWGHLWLERTILDMHNRHQTRKASSLGDLGLNGLALSDYTRILDRSGLAISSFRTNRNRRLVSMALSVLARIPPLRDYCIHNVYCVLEKAPA